MFTTHLKLTGAPAAAADISHDLATGEVQVRLYLGSDLILFMPLTWADSIGEALADADAIVFGRQD